MRHDTLPTPPAELADLPAFAAKSRNPLRIALHDAGWNLDISKKRDKLRMMAYRVVFLPSKETTVEYEIDVDAHANPVDRLLEQITIDTGKCTYDYAVLNSLLMREFIRGTLSHLDCRCVVDLAALLTNYDLACIAKAVLVRFDNNIDKARLLWTEFWRLRNQDVIGEGRLTAEEFTDNVLKLLPCIILSEERPRE